MPMTPLTGRELDVIRLIVAGASNKTIAEELVISMSTVKSHVSHILNKLNVSSRGQAGARPRLNSEAVSEIGGQ